MRPPKIGDILEIKTAKGLAYAQLIHKVPPEGSLIRVLIPLLASPAEHLDVLAAMGDRFLTFFPVGAAVNRKIVRFAGNVAVPDKYKEVPPMRAPGGRTPRGKVMNWWVLEGGKERRVDELTPEQRRWSIASVINDTLLVKRIEQDWRPEMEV
jgi:hypothetical protein